MKVFVAEPGEIGKVNNTDYKWCEDKELLMFGMFQLGNGNPSEISMCGFDTRKFTTHITVKDLDLSRIVYENFYKNSVNTISKSKIDSESLKELVDELLEKAAVFENNEKVTCEGRTLYSIKELT